MTVNIKKEFGNNRKPDLKGLVYGKVPPQQLDFEKDLLGVIIQNKEVLTEVLPILPSADCFYQDAHQKIYSAMLQMHAIGYTIDISTLSDQLNKRTELEIIGGGYYLLQLTQNANFFDITGSVQKALKIKEAYAKREAIRAFGTAINSLYGNEEDFFEVIAEVQQSIAAVTETGGGDTVHVSKVIIEMLQEVEQRKKAPSSFTGLDTGIHELNRITNGWQPADLIILAARPSVGKTALGLNFAYAAASSSLSSMPGLLFSLEMPRKQLLERMASSVSEIPLKDIKTGNLSDLEMKSLTEKSNGMAKLPFFLNDRAGINVEQMTNIIRSYKRKHGIGWVIIDYLQLISPTDKKMIREQQIALISRELKRTAKDLNIPIIALAQINRGVENRTVKKPNPSDLRESGSIEQDADVILMIYTDESEGKINHRINIGKHRNGECADIQLEFIAAIQKWRDVDQPFHNLAEQNARAGFAHFQSAARMPYKEDEPF